MAAGPVQFGIKLALMAGSYLLAPKIEGPRLKTLEVTTAEFGTPFPEVDGYCRIDGCPIGWAEKLREKKVESKTKGGKFANYKYYGTFWVIGAGHEVDAIPRIRMDRHLVYDATKKGPISVVSGFFQALASDSPVKITNGKNMRLYLGTETQGIDPRYEAWCEDRYGPDSATARRGIAGAMFEDIPLEKFGNRIPQMSLDVVRNKTPAYLYDQITPGASVGPVFSKDFNRFLYYNFVGNAFSIWDTATRTKIMDGTLPVNGEWLAYDGANNLWGTGGTLGSKLRMFSPDGLVLKAEVDVGTFTDYVYPIGGDVFLRPYTGSGDVIIQCSAISCTLTEIDFSPSMYFGDLDGKAWTVGMVGTTLYLRHIDSRDQWTFSAPGGVSGQTSGFFNSEGNIAIIIETTMLVIDRDTMTITTSVSLGGDDDEHFSVASHLSPGAAYFYTATKKVDANTLATLQTYSLTSWVAGNTNVDAYEPITHSLFCGALTIRYLDRISTDGITLGDIVLSKCLKRGIPEEEIDVSELTQPVTGYWTIQGSGAEQIAPLLDIHDVDAISHDFGISFRVRGDASDALIDSGEFHANGGKRFDVSMVPESRIPARVEFNYADNTADQQPNTASDSVPLDSVAAQNKKVFDLTTYVSTPTEAQPLVERYLRRQWFEQELGEATLDITWGRLEVGDVKTVDLDGEQRSIRVTELTRQGLLMISKWVRDDPRVHDANASAGPTFDGRDEDEIYVPTPTKAVVMEIPYLNDAEADDKPQIHYGAGNYGGGNWPGAIMWEGDFDNGEYEQWAGVESAEKAVWGYAMEALGTVASPWQWDRGNSIQVNVKGSLTSATEAEILADRSINQAVIGQVGRWEIVNFTTATLLGDNIWEISGFLRGRRGTEWAIGLHEVGDEFWLAEDLKRATYGLSDVGTTEHFKGQTLGRDPTGAVDLDLTLAGDTLKPYAPANLEATRDFTSGDWTISGVRRTRLGGAWVGGTPIPLSEASEAYEIVILAGDEERRSLDVTIDGDGSFHATYAASDQATDFGSVQSTLDVVAYQLSDAVGRGYPATIQATASGDILPSGITAGLAAFALNAAITPVNPDHAAGDTLLCVVMVRGTTATISCATSGWTAADGITNPTTMNGSRMWLFQNECDSDSEANPAITVSGGSGTETVIGVVLRIPLRNTAANFELGTVSSNASNAGTIAFAQNSPSINDGNAIIAIGVKSNQPTSGSPVNPISGVTAGLDWTQLLAFESSLGNDSTFTIDYAINDSGSAYTAGTSGVVTSTYTVGAVSAGVYLEVPLL